MQYTKLRYMIHSIYTSIDIRQFLLDVFFRLKIPVIVCVITPIRLLAFAAAPSRPPNNNKLTVKADPFPARVFITPAIIPPIKNSISIVRLSKSKIREGRIFDGQNQTEE